ncbi:hypothetical protein C922_04480 [Plasmodium inui San Antonio 1]|uniref:Uncharacterized protein n=1 Tax=Plasmodium inui San Antonio 1 TaxID=1237626 RepID=W7A0I9_9APIC|nr:hypothetical protein C922_04480 [Plasmodium inui San Antonio 1]EUD65080.1 hypothetical protein C922_04480 [Plasmodium inui San Antonio 1]
MIRRCQSENIKNKQRNYKAKRCKITSYEREHKSKIYTINIIILKDFSKMRNFIDNEKTKSIKLFFMNVIVIIL